MPGMPIFRPADGLETAMSWAWVARNVNGPAALSLTRQKVKALERPSGFQNEDVWRGAYTVREAEGEAQVVIVASGSEVSLACDTAEKLGAERVPARVVSLPSLELFLEQDEAYQRSIIPRDDTLVVAVEAAKGDTLHRLIRGEGFVYGIDRFGASAPHTDLANFFGFTPDKLCARILEAVRSA
jgi:transketolase